MLKRRWLKEYKEFIGYREFLLCNADRVLRETYKEFANEIKQMNQSNVSILKYLMQEQADVWRAQGRMEEAKDAYVSVQEAFRKTLGAKHLETLRASSQLAKAYSGLNLPDMAKPLLEDVVKKRTELFGKFDESTLRVVHSLLLVYDELGMYEEGEPLAQWLKKGGRPTSNK
jgi:hypothetical protein